jgi:hypothetical protein
MLVFLYDDLLALSKEILEWWSEFFLRDQNLEVITSGDHHFLDKNFLNLFYGKFEEIKVDKLEFLGREIRFLIELNRVESIKWIVECSPENLTFIVDTASFCGKTLILSSIKEFCSKQKIPLTYLSALQYASQNNQAETLNWWLFSGKPLEISQNELKLIKMSPRVLNWWKDPSLHHFNFLRKLSIFEFLPDEILLLVTSFIMEWKAPAGQITTSEVERADCYF